MLMINILFLIIVEVVEIMEDMIVAMMGEDMMEVVIMVEVEMEEELEMVVDIGEI